MGNVCVGVKLFRTVLYKQPPVLANFTVVLEILFYL